MRTAGKVGLDVAKSREDMDDPQINDYLDETIGLAWVSRASAVYRLSLWGVKRIIPGALGLDQLKSYI